MYVELIPWLMLACFFGILCYVRAIHKRTGRITRYLELLLLGRRNEMRDLLRRDDKGVI